MDLYVQIGVLLVLASMFSLLVFLYSDSLGTGTKIRESLYKPPTNYSLDSSVTTPTFYVDARVFTQWAINAKGQREVYILYPTNLTPSEELYGSYLYSLELNINNRDVADRSLKVNPQVPSFANNALFVSDQAPKTIDFLESFSNEARNTATDEVVTVHTFSDTSTGAVIYVARIE